MVHVQLMEATLVGLKNAYAIPMEHLSSKVPK
jgi:hypothetical protein